MMLQTKTQENGYYRFDFARAQGIPHCHYVFRLALAVNDLLSVQQLGNLNQDEMPRHVQSGVGAYLLKLHVGHVVEGYIAFVEKIQPSKHQKPTDLYTFLVSNEKIKPVFERMSAIANDNSFVVLRRLRNAFSFHYNYEKDGKETMTAAASIINSRDGENPDNGLIVRTSDWLNDRFVFADQLTIEGWLNLIGVDGDVDLSADTLTTEHREFLSEATSTLLEFAETVMLVWISENKLQNLELAPAEKSQCNN